MSARSVCIWIAAIVFANASAFAITLGEALDNTNLVWVTATSNATVRPWLATNNPSYAHDGVDGAICGNHYVPSSESWIQTQVVGPGRIGFWWKVDCEPQFEVFPDEWIYADYLEFKIGAGTSPDWATIEPTATIASDQPTDPFSCSTPVGWQYRTFAVPAGTNTLRWNYQKDDAINCSQDLARLDQVDYEFTGIPLPEALDLCAVTWNTAGDAYWVGQTNVTLDGKAAEGGAIVAGQESYLQMVLSGVSNVTFHWRVASLTNSDFLEFYTNSYVHDPFNPPANFAARISGEVTSWRSNFFRLPIASTNTLTWRYVKNSQTSGGQDRGWLDQVKFNPKPLPSPFTLTSSALRPDGRFQFVLVGQSNCTCRVEVSTNLLHWTTLTNLFTASNTTTVVDPGAANAEARFYRGNSQ